MWPSDKPPDNEQSSTEEDEAEQDHSHIKDHDARDKAHQPPQSDEDALDDHRTAGRER